MLGNYHAVSIRHTNRCCAAVKQLDGQRFSGYDGESALRVQIDLARRQLDLDLRAGTVADRLNVLDPKPYFGIVTGGYVIIN